MPATKRLRYEVLRRDNFACKYCGATVPDGAKLRVDAVVPEALGGSHKDSANLVTACETCNNGKSSTSPDAPVVAAVAEDAEKWAHALRAAQHQMLADLEAREADREQFRGWWDGWSYGEGQQRQLVPKDPAWEQTVDQLVSAGLPLRILKDCIGSAMGRRQVRPDQKFRYMCGVAWKKLRELQESAGAHSREPRAGQGADDATSLYEDTIRYLLDFFIPVDIETAKRSIGEDDDPPAPGQYEQAILEHAISAATTDLQWLQSEVLILLDCLPPRIGAEAQRTARLSLYDEYGATFTRTQFIDRALNEVVGTFQSEAVPS